MSITKHRAEKAGREEYLMDFSGGLQVIRVQ